MCEIITIGGRLAHASSLTYRFWGDASREESLFGVTPRARNRFLGWRLARGIAFWGDASREESLFGVTPRARRHPKKCEASPQRLRGVTPKMEGWPLTSFSKIASVGVTPRSKQLGVTPRTPLFEGKNPENQKTKISIK